METGTIAFKDLMEGNHDFEHDVNSCVMMGITIDFKETPADDVQETLEEELRECGFVTSGARLGRLLRITGNVKGDKGRTDWVLVFDGDPKFNFIKRLACPWPVKWVNDFIDNYMGDYEH